MDELAKRFAELAGKYGPGAVDAARSAARVEALSTLFGGLIALSIGGGMLLAAWKIYKKEEWEEVRFFFVVVLCAVGLLVASLGLWQCVDPWTWTSLFNPDVWIAKRILKL